MSDSTERLCRCADEVRCEMKAEIERLREERDFWKESRDFRVKEHLADKAEIERLRAVVDAAKDMTSERACWNPDTGCYDLYKSNGTLEQLIEALDALEDDDE